MEIRFAQAKDVAQILNLLRQSEQIRHAGRPDLFRENARKYCASEMLAMMENPDTPVFVAAEAEQVLGCCICLYRSYVHDPVFCDFAGLSVEELCVDETCRDKQVGAALYHELLRYARMRKCHNVTLNVWPCDTSAMAFCEEMGLKPQKVCMETLLEEKDAGKKP